MRLKITRNGFDHHNGPGTDGTFIKSHGTCQLIAGEHAYEGKPQNVTEAKVGIHTFLFLDKELETVSGRIK